MTSDVLWTFFRWFYFLALGLWLGGIVFLSFIVAPAVHKILPSRSMAGEVVGTILKRLNFLELFCYIFLVMATLCARNFIEGSHLFLWIIFGLIVVMGVLTSFYAFVLTPRMERLKLGVDNFYDLEETSPSRQDFKKIHKLYVRLMSGNLLIGLVVLWLSVLVIK